MTSTIKSFTLWRSSNNGYLDFVDITSKPDGRSNYFRSLNQFNPNEDDLVEKLVAEFVADFNIEYMSSKITETFKQLRERDAGDNNHLCEELIVKPEGPQHVSCTSSNSHSNSDENAITQSELQQKLATLEKDDELLKFYQDKSCSVCLSNYKEILDDKLHILVPSCGHPLCCQCADEILLSEKKECPQCRGNITADSFELMKFNTDMMVESKGKKLYF